MAIKHGSCSAIIEYHAPDFDLPPADAAVIESIEVTMGGRMTDLLSGIDGAGAG